jgi:glycosyltransferase involved in cell wall biosynthesis
VKVLHVITKLDRGGAAHHVRDVVLALRGDHEFVVATGEMGPTATTLLDAGVEVVHLDRFVHRPGPIVDHHGAKQVEALIRSVGPDVVHCHSSKGGLIGRIAARRADVPCVYTAHGWPFMFGSLPHRSASFAAEVALARLPADVICVSEADLAVGRRFVPNHRLHLIRNGIPDDPRRADPGADVDEPHIVMVARMFPPKDHGAAIAALAAVRDLRWRATFVGGGRLFDHWQAVATQHGLADRIAFVGDHDDPAEILASAHIQLHFSGYEGMPLAVLEGMRAGLPVLCSPTEGMRELVGAKFAPPQDVEAAEVLRTLITDCPGRDQAGSVNRNHWVQSHTCARVIAALAPLLGTRQPTDTSLW